MTTTIQGNPTPATSYMSPAFGFVPPVVTPVFVPVAPVMPNYSNMMGQVANILMSLLQSIQGTRMSATPMSSSNTSMMPQDPDAPVPLIELMTYFKKVAEPNLNVTKAQSDIINPWVAVAKPKREKMEGEYAAIRSELREKMLAGNTPEAETTDLINKMVSKERDILILKAECSRLLHDTLTPEQYSLMISNYKASKGLVDHTGI